MRARSAATSCSPRSSVMRCRPRPSRSRRSRARCDAPMTPPKRRARSRRSARRCSGAARNPDSVRGYTDAPMGIAGAQRSDRWLFGPLPDLLFGCGVLYAIAFAAHALAGPVVRGATPSFLLPLLIFVLSSPHYGGTLVRVYEQRRDRQAYVVFTLWI